VQDFERRFIIPLARSRAWRSFCEVGASGGICTDHLLRVPDISYTIIDPCLDADLDRKYASDRRVTVQRSLSLDALPRLANTYDCFVIDGDHNWYTVFNELRLIHERRMLRPGGMIFLHDVDWPYGRRDMYYQPETIPPEYRHEYERKGMIRGRSELANSEGENSCYLNAVREGGLRNGVLTAIEDFLREHPSDYHFCRVGMHSGLGILQYRRKQPLEDLAFLLLQVKARMYSIYGFMRRSVKRVLTPAFG
jgi:hypothetical protein